MLCNLPEDTQPSNDKAGFLRTVASEVTLYALYSTVSDDEWNFEEAGETRASLQTEKPR